MKILITNDDGIFAPGLHALVRAMKKIGSVTVIAPETERSSVGHGITLFQPLWVKKVSIRGKFFGYAISGTPADCIKFGVRMILKQKPDFVVSGINPGENEGCSVFYSGTVAAAREGTLLGIPSFAISVAAFHRVNFDFAAQLAGKFVRFLAKNPLPRGTFLNVNVPNCAGSQIKGIRLTRQGMKPIHTQFHKIFNPLDKEYYWMTGKGPLVEKNMAIDTTVLRQGYVAVTPIRCDQTDEQMLADFPQKLVL